MHSHQITIEDYDQSAELLALDFTTGRLIIRWGSGITSCVSALRWRAGEWHRESVPSGYRVTALAGPAGDSRCRGLGDLFGDVGSRSAGVDDALALVVNRLDGKLSRNSLEHRRGVARWVLGLSSELMHGFELFELLSIETATPVGMGGEVDDLLGVLVSLEIIEPQCFNPDPSALFFGSEATQARGFGRRCGNWPGHRDSSSGPGGPPEPNGSAVGAKHWCFQQGRKFRDYVPD